MMELGGALTLQSSLLAEGIRRLLGRGAFALGLQGEG